jgi:hypothetical protein
MQSEMRRALLPSLFISKYGNIKKPNTRGKNLKFMGDVKTFEYHAFYILGGNSSSACYNSRTKSNLPYHNAHLLSKLGISYIHFWKCLEWSLAPDRW